MKALLEGQLHSAWHCSTVASVPGPLQLQMARLLLQCAALQQQHVRAYWQVSRYTGDTAECWVVLLAF